MGHRENLGNPAVMEQLADARAHRKKVYFDQLHKDDRRSGRTTRHFGRLLDNSNASKGKKDE